jgi:hypothetical protein
MRRRSVLASAVTGALASAFAVGPTSMAQEATPTALAGHPLVGTWAVMTTGGLVPQTHGSDGSFIAAFPPSYLDPALGLAYQKGAHGGSGLGRWESTGERTGRFTFLQARSNSRGDSVGTFQLAADLEVSEDGQTWTGTGSGVHIVVRDSTNTVTLDQVVPIDPPMTATRMGATIESVVPPMTRSMLGTPTP